jgi:hypothetical protein
MSGAADARRREHAARGRGDEARGQEDRARGALDNANAEVRHAIHRGERANERADDGGRRAQAVLADVAGAAKTARVPLGPVPVPVTPTSDNPDPLAGTTPFKPFHGLRPGDVRRRDIDEEAERERKAAESLTDNPLQELGRQMFSSGFAPFDAATFGVAGKVVHKLPGGKRLYGNDAGIAKATQWIGLGHAAERAGVHGAKAAAKGLKRIVERLPDGPIRPISGHTPIPREPRRNPVPRRRSSLARIRRPASLRYAGS